VAQGKSRQEVSTRSKENAGLTKRKETREPLKEKRLHPGPDIRGKGIDPPDWLHLKIPLRKVSGSETDRET